MAAVSTIVAVGLATAAAGTSAYSARQTRRATRDAERTQQREVKRLETEAKNQEISEFKTKVATGRRANALASTGAQVTNPTILGGQSSTPGAAKTLLGQ